MASLVGRRAVPVPYSYRSDPRVPPFPDDRPIFIFDAYCVLCSRWVELVLRYDRAGRFRLLSAQSPLGRALYVHYGLDPENYETNILLIDGIALIKAEGSIRLAVDLGLAVLLEVHDRPELERALSIGAQIVGVNARDLGTFDEDLGVGERLVALVPPEVIAVSRALRRARSMWFTASW